MGWGAGCLSFWVPCRACDRAEGLQQRSAWPASVDAVVLWCNAARLRFDVYAPAAHWHSSGVKRFCVMVRIFVRGPPRIPCPRSYFATMLQSAGKAQAQFQFVRFCVMVLIFVRGPPR